MVSGTPHIEPISITQLLLFADERNYSAYARLAWAAMIEAEQFYRSAALIQECQRFACLPGAIPVLRVDLPPMEEAALNSSAAKSFWNEMLARFVRTVDQTRIVETIHSRFLPKGASYVFIATDQEICPPPNWRYILWDGIGASDVVVSTAPMDPRYWAERSENPRHALKHRFRTALLNALGETIGFIRCDNEQCLLYGNVDSVARLDAMLQLCPEHRFAPLTNRGFAAECDDPEQVQPIITDPPPPKSWGWYA